MGAPQIKYEWSIGNIIQIILICAGGLGMFFTLQADVSANTNNLARLETALSVEIQERRTEREAVRTQVRTLEQSSIRSDERMQNILTLLARIDHRLERIEQEQRQ